MPPTQAGEYLVEYMLTIGPGLSGAMGMIPLDFKEIRAWCECMNLNLSGNECVIIRDLSRAYVGQLNISSKADCPPPWVKGVSDIETHNMLNGMKKISNEASTAKPLSRKTRNKR